MTDLILGPLLRYVGEDDATVWVETDGPCTVEVLGCSAATFSVSGHHYALVHVTGLEPGATVPYEVRLDGERVWPDDDLAAFPTPTIRTRGGEAPLRVCFGSCRVAVPHEPPHSLTKDEDPRGREIDALYALALQMRDDPPEAWPNLLLWIGDQVYADEISPGTKAFIATRDAVDRRGTPHDQVADFEEYTRLYWDAWGDPATRWLLASVPTAMIFDDHDVHDDWNTSVAWVRGIRKQPWWHQRIVGGYASYWIYQHLGNMAPARAGGGPALAAGPRGRRPHGARCWTSPSRPSARSQDPLGYCRDIGRTRGSSSWTRGPDGSSTTTRTAAWSTTRNGTGSSSTDRRLRPPRCWGRRCRSCWRPACTTSRRGTRRSARAPTARACHGGSGEKIRQDIDLEHWAAFQHSFRNVVALVEEIASGRRGKPPATIVFVRRRPPRVPVAGRVPPLGRREIRRLPGRLLAVPKSLGRRRAPGDPVRLLARGARGGSRHGAVGRRLGPGDPLAAGQRRADPPTRSRPSSSRGRYSSCASSAPTRPTAPTRGSTSRSPPSCPDPFASRTQR